MFLLRRPSLDSIENFLELLPGQRLTYVQAGMTNGTVPLIEGSLQVDHNAVCLGRGLETFEQAKQAVRTWRMFKTGWTHIYPRMAIYDPGSNVAVLIEHFGFWSMNGARVVYAIEEARRFGFAYGTLESHAELGEERFVVEWRDDDLVWYDLLAYSKPRHWAARIGNPVVRILQKRFARDSMRAMQSAVRGG